MPPATKAIPKEMLPILNKPLLQYGVEEALAAGITNMAIVTGRGKRSIEDHFDTSFELESQLSGTSKEYYLEEIKAVIEKDGESLATWIEELIDKIGMKLLHGPHFAYVDVEGNKGLTAVAIIETSHIAVHVWEEVSPALMQMDVYTCGPFDPQIVFDFLKAFSPVKIEWKYMDREFDLKTIDVGSWSKNKNS